MHRKAHRGAGLFLLLVALALVRVAGAAMQTKSAPKPTPPSTDAVRRCEAELADARQDETQLLYQVIGLSTNLTLTTLPDSKGRLPIELVAEELGGMGDAYQLAAAEVLHTHFPERLVVEPHASLFLHITGTRAGGAPRVQYIEVSVRVVVRHRFLADKTSRTVAGSFVFVRDGEALVGGSDNQSVEVAKQLIYKVVSEFLQKWEEAKES